MEWLLAHADEPLPEPALAQPESDPSAEVAKSIKCNDCGKLFTSHSEVEFHATKTGHENFCESTEEKRPLTEEEKREQLRKLEEKMRQKRLEREEKDRQEALERERLRIKSGKELTAAKKKMEETEMRKIMEQRQRDKLEDKLARQRVKDQIEQDKLARRARFGGAGATEPSASAPGPSPAPAPAPASAPAPAPAPQRDYSQTRLQIRLTDGQSITQTFGAKEQLSAVRLYVDMNRTDGCGEFSLMTNFPKKVFSDEDYEKPLDVLGLVPSAVLIVTRSAVH
ncbi:UBX domain-containing protein 1 isoform X2 [Bacillus rossius redtenbacheri]